MTDSNRQTVERTHQCDGEAQVGNLYIAEVCFQGREIFIGSVGVRDIHQGLGPGKRGPLALAEV